MTAQQDWPVAIIGSDNLGTDVMIKILRSYGPAREPRSSTPLMRWGGAIFDILGPLNGQALKSLPASLRIWIRPPGRSRTQPHRGQRGP